MLKLVQFISSALGKQGKRNIKVNVMGKGDTQTALQCSPFGVDSNPAKDEEDLIAVYADTSEIGQTVLLGYFNKNLIAEIGEHRIFATDPDGADQDHAYIHLKNDDTMEIGGNADNMIRFNPLDSALQSLKTQIQAELVLIAAGIASAGGAYSPGTLSIDISAAKIDEIKTL